MHFLSSLTGLGLFDILPSAKALGYFQEPAKDVKESVLSIDTRLKRHQPFFKAMCNRVVQNSVDREHERLGDAERMSGEFKALLGCPTEFLGTTRPRVF